MKKVPFPQVGEEAQGAGPRLTGYAWLSIAAALVTIGLKFGAYLITGSVGLLSDAAESLVNLVAAVVALIALTVAARPADEGHHYGHGKAEYFSAGTEGLMIFVAAGVILVTSVQRFLNPVALESVGLGLAISAVASAVNGAVGLLLVRAGRAHRSVTLTADGKHLLTDVWTSIGVIVGVLLVALTGWERLDPIVAAIVDKCRVPSVGAPIVASRDAALVGYGVDFTAMFRRSAIFVDKILKGANPADIPIEQPTKLKTVVNLKTAKALGVEIPPAVLLR